MNKIETIKLIDKVISIFEDINKTLDNLAIKHEKAQREKDNV